MRDAFVPWAVMAVTIIVAIGLVAFFRNLLEMREKLAPEVVHAKPAAEMETKQVTLSRYNLAA